MIYREHAYSVVQTINSNGWTWTVQMEGCESKTGASHRRESAIGAAFAAIDKVIEAGARLRAVSHDVVDGRLIAKAATE